MSDVNDFLSMTPSEVPESVTLPEGSYDFTITSYRSDRVGENQTPLVRINCKAVSVIQSDLKSIKQSAVKMSVGQKHEASQILKDWLDDGKGEDTDNKETDEESIK